MERRAFIPKAPTKTLTFHPQQTPPSSPQPGLSSSIILNSQILRRTSNDGSLLATLEHDSTHSGVVFEVNLVAFGGEGEAICCVGAFESWKIGDGRERGRTLGYGGEGSK